MSSAAFNNMVRLQVERVLGRRFVSKYGIVTGYDPKRYAVKVNLQPEGTQTGFIPLAAAWVGNGWGMFSPPSIGDQVSVVFIEGDATAGYAESNTFNSKNVPVAVDSGEFWLLHKSGQSVKLTNDGTLALNDGHGASMVLNGDGTLSSAGSWKHTGTLEVTDNVTFDANLTVSSDVTIDGSETVTGQITSMTEVKAGSIYLTLHVHNTPSGGSGPPIG